MNITWDANDYEQGFSFVHEYGSAVLDLIDAKPGARVVDLGCGTGALTAELARRGFEVTGIDASPDMIASARRDHTGLRFEQADALTFALDRPADVVFSNAVFHWIESERQDELLANIAANLVEGGQLVCEFGGYGCAAQVHAALSDAFARHGLAYRHPHYFPTIGEYAPRMEAAGLRATFAALFDRPTPQEGADGMANWIRMFLKKPFEGADDELAQRIVYEAVEAVRPSLWQNGRWIVDYVRIRLRAQKVAA